jgi:hypothetical protein
MLSPLPPCSCGQGELRDDPAITLILSKRGRAEAGTSHGDGAAQQGTASQSTAARQPAAVRVEQQQRQVINPQDVPLPPSCILKEVVSGEKDTFGVLYRSHGEHAFGAAVWDGFALQVRLGGAVGRAAWLCGA